MKSEVEIKLSDIRRPDPNPCPAQARAGHGPRPRPGLGSAPRSAKPFCCVHYSHWASAGFFHFVCPPKPRRKRTSCSQISRQVPKRICLALPCAIKSPKKRRGIAHFIPESYRAHLRSMPYPSPASSSSSSILAKCGTTLTCVLRSIPLWLVVIVVLLLGFARRRVSSLLSSEPTRPSSSPAKTDRKTR